MFEIELAGRPVTLLSEKAMWLREERTLLVADAHLGKGQSFRSLGVPVPRGSSTETLARLGALIERTQAGRVVFLGDLLHSRYALSAAAIDAALEWRERHESVEMVLVRGNHDARAGDPPQSLRLAVVDEPYVLGGFALCHHPQAVPGRYALAGHLHPCVSVGAGSFDRLRLACFWFGDPVTHAVGVLPAFGSFTGMHPIRRRDADSVFAVAGERIARVS
jgi:DNA ligase-associated metallophosphoesterase